MELEKKKKNLHLKLFLGILKEIKQNWRKENVF